MRLDVVAIPSATFTLGEGEHAHTVTLAAYHIGRYPITNRDYVLFCQHTGRVLPRHLAAGLSDIYTAHPVVNVTWHDAHAFCAWLSESSGRRFRLPTEAEWEFAARGTDGRLYPWGNIFDKTRCNCCEAGIGWTTPVDAFPTGSSARGVMDLCGNVWEWCSTAFEDYPYRTDDGREDPSGDAWRVLRGGSWLDYEWGLRSARRISGAPSHASHNTGFRVLCED